VPDDREVSDYVGYCHSSSFRSWEKYGLRPLDWEAEQRRRTTYWDRMGAVVRGESPLSGMLTPSGEQAIEIALAIAANRQRYFPAVNIPNEGTVANLTDGGCVEVPAVVDSSGVRGIGVGALPPAIASLCERQLTIQALSVEAALTGSRRLSIEALAIDPVVHDIDAAAAAFEQMVAAEAAYLPTFE
jgi:alpha-galactosidase